MKALLTLFLLFSALLFSASSIAAQSVGSKGRPGGSGSGTPVTGNRPPAAVPCRGRPASSCIPKPPKKCNSPFQGDCP